MLLAQRAVFGCVFGLCLTTGFGGFSSIVLAADAEAPQITGLDLFSRKWKFRDPLCPKGDGLGPCFNAVSCVACHEQGGVGGGGDLQHNVDLLTLEESPNELRQEIKQRRKSPGRWHPSFLRHSSTIVLHHFSVFSDYESYRFSLLGLEYPPDLTAAKRAEFWSSHAKKQRKAKPIELFAVDGLHFRLSHRNTPALFGAGLIDAIPADAIEALEKEQEPEPGTISDISGRIAPAPTAFRDPISHAEGEQSEHVGRFGWRGQNSTLADFVLGACANELGLQTRRHQQALNPLAPTAEKEVFDLSEQNCEKLIQFVRALPRPRQIKPRDPNLLREVNRGEELFRSIGCASCHVEKIAFVDGLYSDLLLHDMGSDLADPVPAAPKTVVVGEKSVASGYFGEMHRVTVLAEVPTETQQEWRTPPLWGVADSAPYLHDGRAETLQAAIILHGGEAAKSKGRFTVLAATDKASLISFLKTLRAPK